MSRSWMELWRHCWCRQWHPGWVHCTVWGEIYVQNVSFDSRRIVSYFLIHFIFHVIKRIIRSRVGSPTKSQPYLPLISTVHGQPFFNPFNKGKPSIPWATYTDKNKHRNQAFIKHNRITLCRIWCPVLIPMVPYLCLQSNTRFIVLTWHAQIPWILRAGVSAYFLAPYPMNTTLCWDRCSQDHLHWIGTYAVFRAYWKSDVFVQTGQIFRESRLNKRTKRTICWPESILP